MNEKTQQTTTVSASSFTEHGRVEAEEIICRELALSIFINGTETATVLCSPEDLEDLVFGLLYSEGVIEKSADVVSIDLDAARAVAQVKIKKQFKPKSWAKPLIATGGGKGASPSERSIEPVTAELVVSTGQIIALMQSFLKASSVYSATRGIHSAAVASPEAIIVRRDDIGRHNALDKIFGSCLRSGICPQDKLVIISGRISSEMLLKVASRGAPILLTKAVPTDMGISLAREMGITLVRCSRDYTVTAYCNDWRIID